MTVNVVTTENFRRDAKKLLKKYRSLKGELSELIGQLEESPRKGTLIADDVYKIRLAVKSKGKGKSGGMRVITFLQVEIHEEIQEGITEVYLLSIYDKSDRGNISEPLLKSLVEHIKEEVEEGYNDMGDSE